MARVVPVDQPKNTLPVLAGILAWIVPGAGHWYLGRRVRAVILFAVILGLFWTGVALGGVFTVNPREETWWSRAQLCTGLSGVASWIRQDREFKDIVGKLQSDTEQGRGRTEDPTDRIDAALAERHEALAPPTSDVALVLSGVAGMLNLMCIFDAVLLSLMGRYGEPRPEAKT